MPFIDLQGACVDIPIYNSRTRSLRTAISRQVGGAVVSSDRDVVTIQALRDVTLRLDPGDRLGIVGHNGAGKSTLLRVFSGAYEPTQGRAEIQGTISSLLDITMGMDTELTGAENIVLRGVFVGMTAREAQSRIDEMAEFAGLEAYIHLPMRTYSSGMVMRLAFAISTTRAPDILLMDELISVGDAAFALKAKTRVDAMIKNAAILVLASHDFAVLRNYCNRAILLESGRVVAAGDVDEVIARYTGEPTATDALTP